LCLIVSQGIKGGPGKARGGFPRSGLPQGQSGVGKRGEESDWKMKRTKREGARRKNPEGKRSPKKVKKDEGRDESRRKFHLTRYLTKGVREERESQKTQGPSLELLPGRTTDNRGKLRKKKKGGRAHGTQNELANSVIKQRGDCAFLRKRPKGGKRDYVWGQIIRDK